MGGITIGSLFQGRRPIGAAVIAAAVAIAIALFFLLDRSGGGTPGSADKVLADAVDAFTNPEGAGLHSYSGMATISGTGRNDGSVPAGESSESTWTVAFQAPDRYRTEMVSRSPAIAAGARFLMVAAGEDAWSYDSQSMTYKGLPAADLQNLKVETNPGMSVCCSLANLLQRLSNGDPSINANIIREDKVLDRDVYVIEVSPVYTSSHSGAGGTPQESAGGTMRLWIDKEFFFTLRLESPAGPEPSDGMVRIDYTSIEFNKDIPADTFQFSPPPGAVEVAQDEATHSGQTVVPGSMPAGFLNPNYRPAGYTGGATGSSSGTNGQLISAYSRFTKGEAYLLVRERIRKDGLPNTIMQGTVVDVNGHTAWLQDAGGARSVIWQDDEIAVQLDANQLSDDELLRVARSMSL